MPDTRVVLDLETKRTFDDVGGRNAHDKLGVSVVGLYEYEHDRYRCFLEHEFGELQNILINSSLIIGFNHIDFDMPVLQPYLSIDVTTLPCFDIMADFVTLVGHRIGLDSIAQASLGLGKIATGLDAIRYYNEGRWDELKEYCLKDVEVTKDVLEFGLKNKKLKYRARFGDAVKEVKVDWVDYGKRKANQVLPEQQAAPAQYMLF